MRLPFIPTNRWSLRLGCGWSSSSTGRQLVTLAMPSLLERPVLDKTNLIGRYDIRLKWAPEFQTAVGAGNLRQEPCPFVVSHYQSTSWLGVYDRYFDQTVIQEDHQ
jgi:hypothetical protein